MPTAISPENASVFKVALPDQTGTRLLQSSELWVAWWAHQIGRKLEGLAWRAEMAECVQSQFLRRQSGLDRVVLSLLQLSDAELAQELYFQIKEKEADFSTLCQYSSGVERYTLGRVGPLLIEDLSPLLKAVTQSCQPGFLHPPIETEHQTYVIVRIEERLPAELNHAMRQKLEDELLSLWSRAVSQQFANATGEVTLSIGQLVQFCSTVNGDES
jgi:hypothetical protein